VRTIFLVVMTYKHSEKNTDGSDDQSLNVLLHLLLDLPSLILISVFSAFSYYLSRLNLEMETMMHEMDDQAAGSLVNRSSLASSQLNKDQFLQVHGEQIRENTSGFAKNFFISANILLVIFYVVCFAKCKSRQNLEADLKNFDAE